MTKEIWSVDTAVPLQVVLDDPECPQLLRQTLTGALSWQARNEMTVARALRSPRLAPQWVAALMALGATVTVDDEEAPLEKLLQRETAGEPMSLRVGVGGVKWGEAHVSRTPADLPIVAAVAGVEMEHPVERRGDVVRQARVALTGVWPEPVRLCQAAAQLVGGPLDESRIQAVTQAVEAEVAPVGDFLGSEEYRRAMASVLTGRALEACLYQEADNE